MSSKRVLPEVKNYILNLGKSFTLSAIDYVEDVTPNTSNIIKTNAQYAKEAYDKIKSLKNRDKDKSSNIFKDTIKTGLKNIKNDLKSGKLYNEDRAGQAAADALGMSIDDDDSDMNWGSNGFDDDNFSSPENEAKESTKKSKKRKSNTKFVELMNSTIGSQVNANAKIGIAASTHITDAVYKTTSVLYSQNEKLHATITGGFTGIVSELQKLNEIGKVIGTNAENAKQYYEESIDLDRKRNAMLEELLTMQRNMYKEESYNRIKESNYQKITSNGFDLKEYVKNIKSNIEDNLPFSLSGNKSGGKAGALLNTLVASPLKVIPDLVIKTTLPVLMDKTVKEFDKSINGFFSTAFAKMNLIKNKTSDSLLEKLLSIFGVNLSSKTKPNTYNYKQGPVPFDGITRKAIIEVIPGLLSRIENTLENKDRNEERIYDYENGQWTTYKEIKSRKDDRLESEKRSSLRDVSKNVDQYITELKIENKNAGERIEKEFSNMLSILYEENGAMDLSDPNAYKHYGFTDKKSFDNIVNIMKKNKKYMYSMAGNVISSKQSLQRYFDNIENSNNPLINLYNNSLSEGDNINKSANNRYNLLTSATDNYNKNIFYYLRGIYSELKYSKNNISYNTDAKRMARPNTNRKSSMELLEDELNNEIKIKELEIKKEDSAYYADSTKEDFDIDAFNDSYLKKLDDIDNGKNKKEGILDKLLKASSLGEKFDVMKKGMGSLLQKPATFLTSVMYKVDKHVFDLLFGDENKKPLKDKDGNEANGIADYFIIRIKNTFDTLQTWLKEQFKKLNDWFKKTELYEWLVKIKDNIKKYTRPVVDKIKEKFKYGKDTVKDSVKNTYGKIFAKSKKIKNTDEEGNTKTTGSESNDIDNEIKTSASGRLVTKRGLTMISPGEIVIPASFDEKEQNKHLKKEIEMKNKYFPYSNIGFNAKGNKEVPDYVEMIWNKLKGVTKDPKNKKKIFDPDKDTKNVNNTVKKVMNEISPNIPDIIADTLIGGGVSLLTGMVGGPLIGAAAGAAIGLTKNSKLLNGIIFGKEVSETEDGVTYKSGGLIPPKVQVWFKKNIPDIKNFGIAGGIAGLVTSVGIIPGLAIGSGIGILKNNEKVQDILFGKPDKNGERDGGLIKKEFREKIKKAAPRMMAGAIGGILTGPFGLLGNAILGSSVGFITTTEGFHNVVFGYKDENGKRHGGIVGKIKKFINHSIDFANKHILNPLKNFTTPFLYMVKHAVTDIANGIKTTVTNIMHKATAPFIDKLQHSFLKNLFGLTKKLLFLPKTLLKGAIAAPFHALGWIGNNIKASQIRKGRAEYMTAEERIKWKKEHKFRNKTNIHRDRFDKFDEMLVKDFKGDKGTEKMQEMRDQLAMYLKAQKTLGEEGAKLQKEVNKDVSKFFNSQRYKDNSEISLYDAIGYKYIKELHTYIRDGKIDAVNKWIDEFSDKMSEEQISKLHSIIDERLNTINKIRNGEKRQSKYLNKKTIEKNKFINRYIKYIDKELDVRKKKKEKVTAEEANMSPEAKVVNSTIKSKSDEIIDLLTRINKNLSYNIEKSTGTTTHKTENKTKEKVKEEETSKNNIDDIINDDTDNFKGPSKKQKKRTIFEQARINKREKRNRVKKIIKDKANATKNVIKNTAVTAKNKIKDKTSHIPGVINAKLNEITKKVNNGYHLINSPDGYQGVANSSGKLIPTKGSFNIDKERAERKREKKLKKKNNKLMRQTMFGKNNPIKAINSKKSGLFGLISKISDHSGMVGKILKLVFLGGTAIALTGHASDVLPKIIKRVGKFLSPVIDVIKKIGSNIIEGLAKAFPNIFGEDGVVTKALKTIVTFISDVVKNPAIIFTKIMDWYSSGFELFKTNILDPLWNWLSPNLTTILYNIFQGGFKGLSEILQANKRTTESKTYQATNEEGENLYIDNETGKITTNANDSTGKENKKYTRRVNVTTKDYNDSGLMFADARNSIFAPKGRSTDYVKEATDPVTNNKYTLILSKGTATVNTAIDPTKGECDIICETTGDYIKFIDFDEETKEYNSIYCGLYCDRQGQAMQAGSIIGMLVGAAIVVGMAIASGGSSLPSAPAAFAIGAKIVTHIGTALKAGSVLGTVAGAKLYQVSGDQYITEFPVDTEKSDIPRLLKFFGLDGKKLSDFNSWPNFRTSAEFENALREGDVEKLESERKRLSIMPGKYTTSLDKNGSSGVSGKIDDDSHTTVKGDVPSQTIHHKNIENIGTDTMQVPDKNTEIKLWGVVQSVVKPKGNLPPRNTYGYIFKKAGEITSWPYLRSYYSYKQENLCYYDTRSAYEALPIEIQDIMSKNDWIPNDDPEVTIKYPTRNRQGKEDKDKVASNKDIPNGKDGNNNSNEEETDYEKKRNNIGKFWRKRGGIVGNLANAASGSQNGQGTIADATNSNTSNNTNNTANITGSLANAAAGNTSGNTTVTAGAGRIIPRGSSRTNHIYQKAINQKFGESSTIARTGCAPVTAANMMNKLSAGARTSVLNDAINKATNYTDSTGSTTVNFFKDYFGAKGFETIDTTNTKEIETAIKSGIPAVLLGNSNSNTSTTPFGENDHYINVYGIDEKQNAIVEDPDLPKEQVKYPLKKVINDTKYATIINDESENILNDIEHNKKYVNKRVRNKKKRTILNKQDRKLKELSGAGSAAQEIWNFYKTQNWSDAGVAGILGNWQTESNLNPGIIEGGKGMSSEQYTAYVNANKAFPSWDGARHVGYGLAQWTGGFGTRKQDFLNYMINFCQKHGKQFNIADFDGQLNYALYEFKNNKNFMSSVPNDTSPEQAATDMLCSYEMPGYFKIRHTIGDGRMAHGKRKARARKWYEQFKGTKGPYTGIIDESAPASGNAGQGGGEQQSQEDNTLFGKIGKLGTSILEAGYGTELMDFLFGKEEAPQQQPQGDQGIGGATGGYKGTSDPNSTWVWPIPPSVPSRITSMFGPRNPSIGSNPHKGVDIGGVGVGKDIVAVAPGEVVKRVDSVSGARGKYVQIRHKTSTGDDMYAIYQHNNSNIVNVGDSVRQGQSVAKTGGSGNGSLRGYGPHLHFEISPNGVRANAVDPVRGNFIAQSRMYRGSGRTKQFSENTKPTPTDNMKNNLNNELEKSLSPVFDLVKTEKPKENKNNSKKDKKNNENKKKNIIKFREKQLKQDTFKQLEDNNKKEKKKEQNEYTKKVSGFSKTKVPTNKISNKILEKTSKIFMSTDGTLYGPALLKAAGRTSYKDKLSNSIEKSLFNTTALDNILGDMDLNENNSNHNDIISNEIDNVESYKNNDISSIDNTEDEKSSYTINKNNQISIKENKDNKEFAKFQQEIIQFCKRISDNTSLLTLILSELIKITAGKVDLNTTVKNINEIAVDNSKSKKSSKSSKSKKLNNFEKDFKSMEGFSGMLDSSSTEYLVQVLNSIASK